MQKYCMNNFFEVMKKYLKLVLKFKEYVIIPTVVVTLIFGIYILFGGSGMIPFIYITF